MTYASLAAVFLAAAVLVAVTAARLARPPRAFWWATLTVAVLLLVLTAVFDSVMVASDLFRYDTHALLGWRVLLVPVEDFAWPLAAVLALPSLWELLGGRTRTPVTTGASREH
jgi:lycopene cyclase domain-containing protein